MRDKGQRFLHRKTADAENPVYENANVSRETTLPYSALTKLTFHVKHQEAIKR